MNRGIVFFDFDGTLVDETARIYRPTAATKEALRQLKENGYLAVLATGRAKCYVPETGIAWDGYVTSNGAHAELCGEEIFDSCMPDELVKMIIDNADRYKYIFVAENQEKCYTNGLDNEHFLSSLSFFDIPMSVFRPVSEADGARVHKMFLTFESEAVYDAVSSELGEFFSFSRHRTNLSCDVDMAGISKGAAISKMAEAAGVSIADTYAFGDNSNDYEMLKAVGTGIAMGAHSPDIEEVCSFVTKKVAEEGISYGLRHAGLI